MCLFYHSQGQMGIELSLLFMFFFHVLHLYMTLSLSSPNVDLIREQFLKVSRIERDLLIEWAVSGIIAF